MARLVCEMRKALFHTSTEEQLEAELFDSSPVTSVSTVPRSSNSSSRSPEASLAEETQRMGVGEQAQRQHQQPHSSPVVKPSPYCEDSLLAAYLHQHTRASQRLCVPGSISHLYNGQYYVKSWEWSLRGQS